MQTIEICNHHITPHHQKKISEWTVLLFTEWRNDQNNFFKKNSATK